MFDLQELEKIIYFFHALMPKNIQDFQHHCNTRIHKLLQEKIDLMNFVKQEEIEQQKQTLYIIQKKLQNLEEKINNLEEKYKNLSSKHIQDNNNLTNS